MKMILCATLIFLGSLQGELLSKDDKSPMELTTSFFSDSPFSYDLDIQYMPGQNESSPLMVCFHGYGGNSRIVEILKEAHTTSHALLGLNFPDFDCKQGFFDPEKSSYGTIEELLPALYVLKKCVMDAGVESLYLYGRSAGGGAVINTIALLMGHPQSQALEKIGITPSIRKKILGALQKGGLILDCPLRSVEEIIDFRGESPELKILARHYRENDLRPIDSVQKLKGLSLQVLVYYEHPDEVISNRDEDLYSKRLALSNEGGRTVLITGKEGGHSAHYHPSLWEAYRNIFQE